MSTNKLKHIHWISQKDAVSAEVIVYDRLLDRNGEPNKNSRLVYAEALIHRDVAEQKDNTDRYWNME